MILHNDPFTRRKAVAVWILSKHQRRHPVEVPSFVLHPYTFHRIQKMKMWKQIKVNYHMNAHEKVMVHLLLFR